MAPDDPIVAAAGHEIPERAAIRIEPGETVEVGERDTTWPAFVFVTTTSGSGWVPERHLNDERPRAVVVHGYDTQELPVSAGERLTVTADDPESGWSWCVNAAGRAGWVPHSALRPSAAG
ncbi:SH3 domain-containing protein [Jiangella sp. DSM 45060]|uniref:SH3 domain-containing protein n=1 Tax=Jiangella sp. DSM 45060 TaxID=1798224 RepID=UPI00087C3D1D|nr:SH3 domain-containing protein [Jiangella sp. DSM 45060]SDT60180.1 Variant SH3 domain-containing protein [Jiangella sp. DSM 45060]